MTFEELDQRTILWNEIANGHRTIRTRINTQIDLCHEEMNKEYFFWLGEWNKFKPTYSEDKVRTELLDGYADSRFVYVEFGNLCTKTDSFDESDNWLLSIYGQVFNETESIFDYSVMQEAYRRVIESNFSKFVELSEKHDLLWAQGEARKMSERYLRKIKPELTQGYWVFRDQNGKIRKPSTFKPVDLSDLLYATQA